jgi:hypothetical protein
VGSAEIRYSLASQTIARIKVVTIPPRISQKNCLACGLFLEAKDRKLEVEAINTNLEIFVSRRVFILLTS